MSRYDVFISYKHNKDEAAAKRIAEIIERQTGLRCWYDEYLRGGDEYDRIIFKRIEECTYFAFVMSEDSLQSVYCSAELKHAIHHGKSLVPVNLDNALPLDCIRYDIAINTTAQVRLQKIHWIDYSSTDLEGDIRNAFRIDHAPKTQPDTPSDPAKYDQPEPADEPKGGAWRAGTCRRSRGGAWQAGTCRRSRGGAWQAGICRQRQGGIRRHETAWTARPGEVPGSRCCGPRLRRDRGIVAA